MKLHIKNLSDNFLSKYYFWQKLSFKKKSVLGFRSIISIVAYTYVNYMETNDNTNLIKNTKKLKFFLPHFQTAITFKIIIIFTICKQHMKVYKITHRKS